MNGPTTFRAVIALAVMTLAAGVLPVRAATKLEGDYQLMLDLRKNDRPYLWQFDSNNNDTWNGASFRLFSQPRTGIESFVKFEAAYRQGDNDYLSPQFQYREGHLRFRKEMGKRGFDTYVFSRQDRFWVNTFLVPWVNGRGDAQGVRLDTWGFGKTNATFIVADQSGSYNPANYSGNFPHYPVDSIAAQNTLRTDDEYVVRLRREFLKDNALRVGLTYNRFEGWSRRDSLGGANLWNAVLGFDSRLRVRGTDISLEYGESRDDARRPEYLRAPVFTVFKNPLGFRLPDHAVMQAEVRSIRIGTPRTGFLSMAPGWWARGPKWQNSIGGPNKDENGFFINSYYLLPDRAITYTNNLLWYGPHATTGPQTRQIYNELYIEFVNGFTGKTAYKRTDIYRPGTRDSVATTFRETHLQWFNELQVESRLAWMRIQSKVTDIGTNARKELFVLEASLNLSQRTKIYNRYAFGNDPSILRKGIFTQLQYRPTGNTEMYLQYGPDYIGGGSMPVDEGNLNGSSDQKDMVKFILKGSF